MPDVRPTDELDVREILRAIRAEVLPQAADTAETSLVSSNDFQVIRTCHDVRHYEISTDKSLAPLVIGAKKLVEAVVRPYAGHFLDKQARFNAALNRIVSRIVAELEGINNQLAVIKDEQRALQQLIRSDMEDLRSRIERLRHEMAERHENLHGALHAGLEEQERRQAKREASRAAALNAASQSLHQSLNEAVERLQVRLAEIEQKTVESQKDLQERLSREISAVVDFIEEVLPGL